MRKLLAALAVSLSLTGCASMAIPTPVGAVPITSNPLAQALNQCALLAEILTPGINLGALADLARGALGGNALGNTVQGAMRNCIELLDKVAD